MKLLGLLTTILASCLVRGFEIAGPWIQPLSNNYVQQTTEVDWKCVQVEMIPRDKDQWWMIKTANVHGLSALTIFPAQQLTYLPHKNVVHISYSTDRRTLRSLVTNVTYVYTVRYFNDSTMVVLTGDPEPSVFVWVRPWASVSLPDIVAKLHQWAYTGTDKEPQSTIDPSLCPLPPNIIGLGAS